MDPKLCRWFGVSSRFCGRSTFNHTTANNAWRMDFIVDKDIADPYVVLLYYSYSPVLYPNESCREQLGLCEALHLCGRIRVASEGINGTLGGRPEDIAEYTRIMDAAGAEKAETPIHWKLSKLLPDKDIESQKFKKLSVKVTKEVVSMDLTEREKDQLISGDACLPLLVLITLFLLPLSHTNSWGSQAPQPSRLPCGY